MIIRCSEEAKWKFNSEFGIRIRLDHYYSFYVRIYGREEIMSPENY